MLLHVDEIHENWENGGASDWELLDVNCSINNEKDKLPFAISRLNRDLNETGRK